MFDNDIAEQSFLAPAPAREELAVVVNDSEAVYPVRIDPTFSDANWVSMGGVPGANGPVDAAGIDGSGNLYIGGQFTVAGNAIANYIAKWNGSSWSAIGSGMNNTVSALAVSGSTLYAGGYFPPAGGNAANYIAQWNGSSWSALGSGMNSIVWALAVSGGALYAGGDFTTAGGKVSAYAALAYLPGSIAIITPTRRLASRMESLVSTCPARPARTWSFRPAPTCKLGFRCKPICSAAARSISPIRSPPTTSRASTAPNYCPNARGFSSLANENEIQLKRTLL